MGERGQSEAVEVIPRNDLSTPMRVGISSFAEEKGNIMVRDCDVAGFGDESCSDIDPKEIRILDEGLTWVEVRTGDLLMLSSFPWTTTS